MPISEAQLETWAHQGSVAQSASTYQIISNALGAAGTPIHGRDYEIFLQGSYGNHTNIYAESDVDVVIRLNETYYSNSTSLPLDQYLAWEHDRIALSYSWTQFRTDVLTTLNRAFGTDVTSGARAIAVAAGGSRRKADVLVAAEFRNYASYSSAVPNFVSGICFWDSAGQEIVNYPKQHAANLIAKQQATGGRFKPMVRVLKNLRSRLESEGLIVAGSAPSYFVEGLLYNVPAGLFASTFGQTFVSSVNWLQNADRRSLLCANLQSPLIRDGNPTCWRVADANAFVDGLIRYWNEA
ncbi:MAG TPA: nucleotidyltransferase [Stenotrophomonas sp.]|nr:nucleotidyltransferase [Stenotrophomonas sp.]